MKLYYKAGACSLASHIILNEIGAQYDLVAVDLKTKLTAAGDNYLEINPKGSVPALQLNDGSILTEGAVILQYLADQKPEANLLPKYGTMERIRAQELLNFIAADVHKGFSPLFAPTPPSPEAREGVVANLARKFGFLENHVLADGRDYLTGSTFTVADAYLFVVMNWSGHVGIDLAAWPKLKAFVARVAGREKTLATLRAEGLIA